MARKKKHRLDLKNTLFTVRTDNKTITFGLYVDAELFGEDVVPFAGVAQRSPDDKDNATRGVRVSTGYAYRNLGREILKREHDVMRDQGMGVYKKSVAKEISQAQAECKKEHETTGE